MSPGVAVGAAFVVLRHPPIPAGKTLPELDAEAELDKLRDSIGEVKKELAFLKDQVSSDLGEEQSAILDVQMLVVEDIHFVQEIEKIIREQRWTYEAAIGEVLRLYEEKFERAANAYLRDKFFDVKDVLLRMLDRGYLRERQKALSKLRNCILVSEQILPTTLLGFNKKAFDGIVTVTGGLGSHAVILARSYGIPAIGVAKGVTKRIQDGDVVFLDGYESALYINPDEAARQRFQRETEDFKAYHLRIERHAAEKAKTHDGVELKITANCGNLDDLNQALATGAEGVGLFRTELMFYSKPRMPTEDEQYALYRKAAETFPDKTVTIRTLDLGGDKALPYFLLPKQVNPYLGWRSLKISFDHPHEFKIQIKAILRAGCHGRIQMLFPMVTNYSDVSKCREYIAMCEEELREEAKPFDENMQIGAMIETPSAVTCLAHILPEVNFISIGTNDLIQHILAVDRDNPRVSEFYVAHHPAVLMSLKTILTAAAEAHCPVSLCGEMASQVIYTKILLGLGLRRFSVAPSLVPILKDVLRHLDARKAEAMAAEILKMKTSEEIIAQLRSEMDHAYPDMYRVV